MTPEVMAEYLVRLSADVDTNSFNSAMTAINQLSAKLKQVKGIAAAAALSIGLGKIGAAAVDAVKDVARADLEFAKLGQRMWITKDSAKALSVAMKTMGCTEEDIAWVPELREQFFRLKNEMDELSTPADAEDGLKYVRSISYEIESLQVKFKMLKEWIVYYLIKIIRPFMDEFKEWVQWLNGKLKGRMPDIAKNIAKWLGFIVSLASTAMKAIRKIGESIYNFFEEMPESAKKWGAILAGVGAFVLASPLGKLITVLGGALMLLEDFMYYANGWNSSKALAPVWKTILEFLESDTLKETKNILLDTLGKAGDFLDKISKTVGRIIRYISAGMDWEGMFDTWKTGFSDLWEGVHDLYTELGNLFSDFAKWTGIEALSSQKSFWNTIGNVISSAVKNLMKFAGVIGKVFKAVACALRGDFSGAFAAVKDAVKGAGEIAADSVAGMFGGWAMDDSRSREDNAMDYLTNVLGLTREGAAGLVGNLKAESRVQADAVQGDFADPDMARRYLSRLKNGEMTRDEFIYDEKGFGLAQWTSADRKAGLWDYWKNDTLGRSIDDMSLQLEYLHKELQERYGDTLRVLKTTHDVDTASNYVMTQFERPADMSRAAQAGRASIGRGVLARYTPKPKTPPIAESSKKWQLDYSGGRSSGGDFLNWGQNAAANMSMAKTSAYTPPASSVSRNTTFGDIIVNVAGTNATAGEIGNAVWDKINARMNRGVTV